MKVDVKPLLKPFPSARVSKGEEEFLDKLSISDKEMELGLGQDNLLDSNLLLSNSIGINDEEDLLTSNIDDEILGSANRAVNLLDDPMHDENLFN